MGRMVWRMRTVLMDQTRRTRVVQGLRRRRNTGAGRGLILRRREVSGDGAGRRDDGETGWLMDVSLFVWKGKGGGGGWPGGGGGARVACESRFGERERVQQGRQDKARG